MRGVVIGEMVQADPASRLSEPTQKRLQDGLNIVAGLANQVRALLLICKAESANAVDRELVSPHGARRPGPDLAVGDAGSRGRKRGVRRSGRSCVPALARRGGVADVVENSLKYRSERAPVIRVERSVRDGAEVITVADNGLDLSADDARRLFASRSQLDPARPGVGLGLMICRNIVELHKGAIWVEEVAGSGARISFTLGQSRPTAVVRAVALVGC